MIETSPANLKQPDISWAEWRGALQQFSAATGLVVSAFDAGGRRLGPFRSSRFAAMLATSQLWADGGPGTLLEQQLVAKVMRSGQDEHVRYCDEIPVHGIPLKLFDTVRGVIVFGWTFDTFATGLGCQRIAMELGLPAARLWSEARLETPVPASRMAVYADLLNTMVTANARQVEAIERLHELSRVRELFLASVSHELRTPLSAISLRLQVLLRGQLDNPEVLRASLRAMMGHVSQESKLIEDLIDAARTRTGQLSIKPALVPLATVLYQALEAVQPQADTKQVVLEVHGLHAEATKPLLRADGQRLQQLFWNLLSNAVKFSNPGGKVRMNVHADSRSCQIEVQDFGRGIDPRFLPNIFDAFKKQELDNLQGLGLGLFIAKHVAELHDGTISVASDGLERGATFTVTLPLWDDLVVQP